MLGRDLYHRKHIRPLVVCMGKREPRSTYPHRGAGRPDAAIPISVKSSNASSLPLYSGRYDAPVWRRAFVNRNAVRRANLELGDRGITGIHISCSDALPMCPIRIDILLWKRISYVLFLSTNNIQPSLHQ